MDIKDIGFCGAHLYKIDFEDREDQIGWNGKCKDTCPTCEEIERLQERINKLERDLGERDRKIYYGP